MTLDDLYDDLIEVVSEAAAQVDIPIESEEFFSKIVKNFDGSKEECLMYIEANVKRWFRCITERPKWIQEAEWQFNNGNPMVFVGQVEVDPASGFFHDSAIFYLFWDSKTGETKTAIQVA